MSIETQGKKWGSVHKKKLALRNEFLKSSTIFGAFLGTPMRLPPADGCSSSRAMKLYKYVHHCIPWVWGLLIRTFSKKVDSLPAVMRVLEILDFGFSLSCILAL